MSDAPSTSVLETPEKPFTGWMQLTLEDLPALWDSGTPFARKVDALSRPQVAAAIDEVVDQARFSEQIAARHEDHEERPPR